MKKILAIDDQQDNLTTIKAVIKIHIPDCFVLTALSGKEGMEIARKDQPDTILLDIIMPGMDGYEVCKKLKSDELTKHIPVLMLTAIKTDIESRVKGLEIGADAFLSKPIDPVELSAQVKVMLRIRKAENQLRVENTLLDQKVKEKVEKIKEQEKQFRLIAENTGDNIGITTFDLKAKYLYVSPSIKTLLGYDSEELIGKSFFSFIHPEDKKELLPLLKNYISLKINKLLLGKEATIRETIEYRFKNKEGNWRFLQSTVNIAGNNLLAVTRDITEKKLAEKALRESEELYKSLITNSSDLTFLTDEKGIVHYVSPQCEEVIGYPIKEIEGLIMPDFIYPKDKEKVAKSWENVYFNKKDLHDFEYRIVDKKGKIRWISHSAKPIMLDRKISVVQNTIRNIDKRKQAEKELKESKNFFEQLFIQSSTSTQLLDPEGWCVRVNPKLSELFGVRAEDIEGKKYNILQDGEIIRTGVIDKLKRVFEYKETVRWEVNFDIKFASETTGVMVSKPIKRWFYSVAYPILNTEGELTSVIIQHEDITERKLAQESLKQSEERYQTFIKHSDEGIYRIELKKPLDVSLPVDEQIDHIYDNAYIAECNEAFVRMYGADSIEEILNTTIDILHGGKNNPVNRTQFRIFIESGYHLENAETIESTKNGELRWFSNQTIGIVENGYLQRLWGTQLNITDLKQLQLALTERERTYRTLINNLPGFSYRCENDRNWTMKYISSGCFDITGYKPEDLIDNKLITFNDIIKSSYQKQIWNIWQKNLEEKSNFEFEYPIITKDGKEKWIWERGCGIYDDNGDLQFIEGFITEVTERKRSEQIQKAILEIAKYFHESNDLKAFLKNVHMQINTVLNARNIFIALYNKIDRTYTFPYFEDETEAYENGEPEKLEGSLTDLVRRTGKGRLITEEIEQELQKTNKIELIGSPSPIWLGAPLFNTSLKEVIGVIAIQDYHNVNAYNLKDLEILEIIGHNIGMFIERIQNVNELTLAKEKAEESDRLKSAFLATISHELRTPLNAIIGFSDIINEDLSIQEIMEFNKTINSSGNHLLNIVEDIFDITLIEAGEIKIIKDNVGVLSVLNEVNEIIKIEQKKMGKNHLDLKMIIPKGQESLTVNTDASKLKQIILNLLKNALKFTPEGYINYGFSIGNKPGSPVIQFFVEDSGIGISKEKQELIFDIFRQVDDTHTREHGGTGIGLSISKKLTHLLGGEIWVDSQIANSSTGEKSGSTFYFTIPLTEVDKKSPLTGEEKTKPNNLKNRIVLIVEDDKSSYEYLQVVVENLGIQTIWAKDGQEAVEYCKSLPGINLVLMDINMPVMNGYEATKVIKKIRPNLPIIAQTAYAIAGDKEKSLEAGCDDYISKPIKRNVITEKIKKFISVS